MQYSYVTVLSNWLRGYDRYRRVFSKKNIGESTYPNEFYLLKSTELDIGLNKAERLLSKVAIPNDRIIRVETCLDPESVSKNTRNGLGWFIPGNEIKVDKVHLYREGVWEQTSVEELSSEAFSLNQDDLLPWTELQPLTLSFLPVAIACQASCLFCFSGSSISIERRKRIQDFEDLNYWCQRAKQAGAKRFVLTGGGEPTILPFTEILSCIKTAGEYFDKTVLISNGIFLSKETPEDIRRRLHELHKAGLSKLSISCHHHDEETNLRIMGINTQTSKILKSAEAELSEQPTIRLICVLQKTGIATVEDVESYIAFAKAHNVGEVCFKELYVSATNESLYSGGKENLYSLANQVSLEVVHSWAKKVGAEVVSELPWGSPIFEYEGMTVAAYTEPSVGWERSQGIARSWNFMADNKVFASLEDEGSIIEKELN